MSASKFSSIREKYRSLNSSSGETPYSSMVTPEATKLKVDLSQFNGYKSKR